MGQGAKRIRLWRRLWWLWSFLVPFFVVEAWNTIGYYFHEANHSNEGLDVLWGSIQFSLYFAVPAGVIGLVIAGLIYFVLEMRKTSQS